MVLAPATLWPPERMATSSPLACAWASAAWTSATDSHWAMSAGPAVDHGVEDRAGVVVAVVAIAEQGAAEAVQVG